MVIRKHCPTWRPVSGTDPKLGAHLYSTYTSTIFIRQSLFFFQILFFITFNTMFSICLPRFVIVFSRVSSNFVLDKFELIPDDDDCQNNLYCKNTRRFVCSLVF